MHVNDLAVTSAHRRRGIGLMLMDRLEEWARQRGVGTMTLNVHVRNAGALALYKRQGFRQVQVEMRKDLPRGGVVEG